MLRDLIKGDYSHIKRILYHTNSNAALSHIKNTSQSDKYTTVITDDMRI